MPSVSLDAPLASLPWADVAVLVRWARCGAAVCPLCLLLAGRRRSSLVATTTHPHPIHSYCTMRLAPRLLGAAVLLGCAASAAAHVGHGVPRAGRSSAAGVPLDLYERHAAGSAVRHAKVARRRRSPAAAAPTSEAQEAAITDETDACTPYSIPEVSALEGSFPTVWEIADILPGDAQAQGVWSAIQKSGIIPKSVKPKGTRG